MVVGEQRAKCIDVALAATPMHANVRNDVAYVCENAVLSLLDDQNAAVFLHSHIYAMACTKTLCVAQRLKDGWAVGNGFASAFYMFWTVLAVFYVFVLANTIHMRCKDTTPASTFL